jgi:hypothetical protein
MRLKAFKFVLILLAGIALGIIWTRVSEYHQLQKAFTDLPQFEKIVGSFGEMKADSSTVKFRLSFYNNPLEFDSTNRMWVALNHVLVYEGPYSDKVEVLVPKNLIGKGVRPYLLIKRGDKLFDGWKKERMCFYLNPGPGQINYLNVIFFPELTAPGNYKMFSGWLGQ